MLTFQIYKDRAGEFRWRLTAANNEIIADSSEGYVNKSDCRHAVDVIKRGALNAKVNDLTS